MCSSTKTKANRREGAVLLLVLGTILLAGWMLVQIIARVRDEVELRGVEDQGDAIRSSAFQALEIAMGVLGEIQVLDGGLYNPAQGWGDPLGYAGFPSVSTNAPDGEPDDARAETYGLDEVAALAFPPGIEVEVRIRDESGRLPLNHTSAERWKLLFEAMEIQSSDAAILADTLLDWIDADNEPRLNGAEAEVYQRRDPPYLPANAPIDDIYQIRLIEGFDRLFFDAHGVPNELFRTFRECVTEKPNLALNFNTMPSLVLDVLAEELDFEADRVRDYLDGPDREPGTGDDRVLRPGLDQADVPNDNDGEPLDFSATSRYLVVDIAARSAGTVFWLTAWLDTGQRPGNNLYPMAIMDLQTKGSDL